MCFVYLALVYAPSVPRAPHERPTFRLIPENLEIRLVELLFYGYRIHINPI
jgi:hypothetical protein